MKCCVCNSQMKLLLNKTKLYQCENCKHIYKIVENNLVVQKEYHVKLARNPIKFKKDGNINEIFHIQRELIVTNRLNKIESYLDKGQSVLDVGGSAGTFANKIKSYVKEIDITDLADYQKKESERLGFKFYQGDFTILKFSKTYDIITCWHVLEHIKYINIFMEKLKKVSKKEGYIFIEIPYNRKINENKENGHLQYFNVQSFTLFIKKYFILIDMIEGVQKPALLAICKNK